ncbi:MAG: DUF5655 domain-containing protein [Methanobacteriaceae archaeon]
MPLFEINAQKLEPIKKAPFKLEKDMQKLTEDNLEMIFNLKFISTEFRLNNLIIDTLAYDAESKAFVIIEYKNIRTFSVIDQGFAYLALLLNNKADFILEYNEKMGTILKKRDVDWTQSRVIFVSPNFTKYQQQAIEFKDLPIELWEIGKYSNNTVLFNQLKSPDTNESINTITKNNRMTKLITGVKVYNEEDHLNKISEEEVKNLYYNLKNKILGLDEDIKFNVTKAYLSFSLNSIFTYMMLQKKNISIVVNFRKGDLDDPENIIKSSAPESYGKKAYTLLITPSEDIDYIIHIIKQSYKNNL